jgi:RNA polymerase sigma-70 factor (ECF subfamily)
MLKSEILTEQHRVNPAEELLITQAMNGNKDAYAKLYSLYYKQIMFFINSLVHNIDIAEQLTQEAFIKGFLNTAKYENRGHPYGVWLTTIARNLASNYLNRDVRRHAYEIAIEDVIDRFKQTGHRDPVYAEVVKRETLQALQAAIEELSPHEKAVVRLKLADEFSDEEIASQLELTVSAVKSAFFRAKQNLEKLLSAIPKKNG